MKLNVTIFALVLMLCSVGFADAQDLPKAKKIYDLPTETSDKVFYETLGQFLKKLKQSPSTTIGFIAIDNDAVAREGYLKALVKKLTWLANRIEFSHPGTAYNSSWSSSEFWLVPEGADPPYQPMTSDVSCPTIDISGPWIAKPGDVLTFTAEIRGAPLYPIGYKWTVDGGKILKYNEASIDVRVNANPHKLVIKLTAVGLTDEFDTCPKTAVQETRIVPERSSRL